MVSLGLASVAIRRRSMNAALFALALALPRGASAQGTLDDYRRAARSTSSSRTSRRASCRPSLVRAKHQACTASQSRAALVRVDAEQWSKQPAFDHAGVASSLSAVAGQPYTEVTLPFPSIVVVENGAAFEGDAAGSRYRCTIATSVCVRVGAAVTATAGGRTRRRGGQSETRRDASARWRSNLVSA
jgi:hypothetical protein